MIKKVSTAIIGGGIIGMTIALELALRDIDSMIIDEPTSSKTTAAAAGMIAPISEAVFNEGTLIKPNLHAQQLWSVLADKLTELTGKESSLSNIPSLLIAKTKDDKAIIDNLVNYYEQCNLKIEKLSNLQCGDVLAGLTPNFNSGALLLSDYFVEPLKELDLIEHAYRKLGGEITNSTATSLDINLSQITLSNNDIIEAKDIVLATGNSGAEILGREYASKLQVIKVKGQIMTLKLNEKSIKLERVLRGFVKGTPVYLVPRSSDELVVGATQEYTGFDIGNTAEGLFNLIEPAISLFPSLREAEIKSIGHGFRPGTVDNIAYIGRIESTNIICAFGHYRHGVLQAPLTAEIVADEIQGESNQFVEVFSPNRTDLTQSI